MNSEPIDQFYFPPHILGSNSTDRVDWITPSYLPETVCAFDASVNSEVASSTVGQASNDETSHSNEDAEFSKFCSLFEESGNCDDVQNHTNASLSSTSSSSQLQFPLNLIEEPYRTNTDYSVSLPASDSSSAWSSVQSALDWLEHNFQPQFDASTELLPPACYVQPNDFFDPGLPQTDFLAPSEVENALEPVPLLAYSPATTVATLSTRPNTPADSIAPFIPNTSLDAFTLGTKDESNTYVFVSPSPASSEQTRISTPPVCDASYSSCASSPAGPVTPFEDSYEVSDSKSSCDLVHSHGFCDQLLKDNGALGLDVPESIEQTPATRSVRAKSDPKPEVYHVKLKSPEPELRSAGKQNQGKTCNRDTHREEEQPPSSAPAPPRFQTKQVNTLHFPIRRTRKKQKTSNVIEAVLKLDEVELLSGTLGQRGRCKFPVVRDGVQTVCDLELVNDDSLLYAHFTMHYEDLGYYDQKQACVMSALAAGMGEKRAKKEDFMAPCPWCKKATTKFGGLSRHIVYSELRVNSKPCPCGGSNSRSNQRHNWNRHVQSEMHQAYLRRKAEKEEETQNLRKLVAFQEKGEFVEGSSRGTKRRRHSE